MCNKKSTDLGVEVFLVQKCFIYQGSSQEVKKGGPDMLVMSQALAEKPWKDLWSTLKALGWGEELGSAGFARLQTYYMPPGVSTPWSRQQGQSALFRFHAAGSEARPIAGIVGPVTVGLRIGLRLGDTGPTQAEWGERIRTVPEGLRIAVDLGLIWKSPGSSSDSAGDGGCL